MVKPFYVPADKRLPTELKRIQRSLEDVQRPTGTEKDRTLMRVQAAVVLLATQQAELAAAQAATAAAVAELEARSAHSLSPANLSISAATPGVFPTEVRSLSFPAPVGGGRVATLALSAEFVRTTASGNVTIWIEILQNGVSTWKRSGAFYVGDTASAPAAWGNPSINEPMQLEVPNAAAASMQIRLHAHVFTAGTVTARMQNIRATLTYGARI